MAFWNAPTDQADHRQLAIQAAHSMNEALDKFNLKYDELIAQRSSWEAMDLIFFYLSRSSIVSFIKT